jgi:regulator of cell morphogenesis and NO signaling
MLTEGEKSVRELVLEKPTAARVFEKFGIDYCCGGNKSLIDACVEAKVKVEEVIAALAKPESVPTERDWRGAPLSELAQYIVDKHHSFTRDEIKRLVPLISKVVSMHGNNHPELLQVESRFQEMAQELTMHMGKEEQVLFPYIAKIEEAVNSKRPLPRAMFGTVQNPVRMMMMEHESSGQALHKMREATNGYVPPPDGCVTYETLYRALEAFEKDLHNHIHLENNILFPRSVDLEKAAR